MSSCEPNLRVVLSAAIPNCRRVIFATPLNSSESPLLGLESLRRDGGGRNFLFRGFNRTPSRTHSALDFPLNDVQTSGERLTESTESKYLGGAIAARRRRSVSDEIFNMSSKSVTVVEDEIYS